MKPTPTDPLTDALTALDAVARSSSHADARSIARDALRPYVHHTPTPKYDAALETADTEPAPPMESVVAGSTHVEVWTALLHDDEMGATLKRQLRSLGHRA